MVLFLNPQTLLLFDIPLFLLFFGIIFLVTRLLFIGLKDPVANTAIAAVAAGAAFIIVRSQTEIQRWLWFNPNFFYGMVILVFILIVISMILKV